MSRRRKAALANLAAVDAEARRRDDPIAIDVYLAGFSVDFVDRGDGWTTVDAESRPGLFDRLDEFEALDQGVDTDYVRALRGAAEVLEGEQGCHLVLWFTDGKYDIDPTVDELPRGLRRARRRGSPRHRQAARSTTSRSAATGSAATPATPPASTERTASFLITSVLSFDDPEEQRFTQRVTEGIDEAGETCGDLAEQATETGKYQSADDLIDLFFDFETIFWDVREIRAVDNPVAAPFGTTLIHFSAQLGIIPGRRPWSSIQPVPEDPDSGDERRVRDREQHR